mmetsp:Transcript_30123/g.66726  ORF Transcript_30123/g.66726 Transcript_30123/m.66726 type:complete len:225 (+) Transcript_30123:1344-2018(+)
MQLLNETVLGLVSAPPFSISTSNASAFCAASSAPLLAHESITVENETVLGLTSYVPSLLFFDIHISNLVALSLDSSLPLLAHADKTALHIFVLSLTSAFPASDSLISRVMSLLAFSAPLVDLCFAYTCIMGRICLITLGGSSPTGVSSRRASIHLSQDASFPFLLDDVLTFRLGSPLLLALGFPLLFLFAFLISLSSSVDAENNAICFVTTGAHDACDEKMCAG